MAFIRCSKCGGTISDKVQQCPHCGTNIDVNNSISQNHDKQKTSKGAGIYGVLSVFFMLLLILFVKKLHSVGTVDSSEIETSQKPSIEVDTAESNARPAIAEKNIWDKEIVFRDIPWGISFDEVEKLLGDLDLIALSGEAYVTPSVDAILEDNDYKGIEFEYGDINIVATALKQTEVAGYTTADINGVVLYFVYAINDGQLMDTSFDSMFYGAKYTFEPLNREEMSQDLEDKLVSLYGEPYETYNDTDIWGCKYTYIHWLGQNNTELMLTILDASEDSTEIYDDQISISYAWRTGDELLQNASDLLKQGAIEQEQQQYGNGNTDGL